LKTLVQHFYFILFLQPNAQGERMILKICKIRLTHFKIINSCMWCLRCVSYDMRDFLRINSASMRFELSSVLKLEYCRKKSIISDIWNLNNLFIKNIYFFFTIKLNIYLHVWFVWERKKIETTKKNIFRCNEKRVLNVIDCWNICI
jgi:hypothetical protein